MRPGAPVLVNAALLLLYPLAWIAPLASASLLPLFGSSEISILTGILDLAEADLPLAILVALLAVVAPYAKTLALLAVHMGKLALTPRRKAALEWLGKLSMADVFLIALYVVVVKGVGIGSVQTAWGLYLFTGCVLLSLWAAAASKAD